MIDSILLLIAFELTAEAPQTPEDNGGMNR